MVPIQKWINHKNAIDVSSNNKYGKWKTQVLDWDYAILLLKMSVQFTTQIQPVCLPSKPDQDYSNKIATASGWGNTEVEKNDSTGIHTYQGISDVPKHVKLQVVSEETCQQNYNNKMCRHCRKSTMVCAYGIEKFNETVVDDACVGDSGGKIYF